MDKIGIVTSVKELNYGAILQAYALQNTLKNLGYEVVLLWWNGEKNSHRDIRLKKLFWMGIKMLRYPTMINKTIKIYFQSFEKSFSKKSIELFEEFEKNNLKISYFDKYGMKRFAKNKKCIAIIAGSDQIWNSHAIYVDPFYYLRFSPVAKRVAYAPSLGKESIARYNKNIMRKYIGEIPYLSVREKRGKVLIEELLNKKDIPVVLDPSLLIEKDKWMTISRDSQVSSAVFYLFYFLDEPTNYCMLKLKEIIGDSKIPIIALPYQYDKFNFWHNVKYIDAGPAEFLDLICKANKIFTDSFHGTAFSINFNKDFYVFDRKYRNNETQVSRITDILELFGIKNRFLSKLNDNYKEPINYLSVNKILDEQRACSLLFIEQTLKKIREKDESRSV